MYLKCYLQRVTKVIISTYAFQVCVKNFFEIKIDLVSSWA